MKNILKKFIVLLSLSFVLLSSSFVFAEDVLTDTTTTLAISSVSIHLKIILSADNLYDKDITVTPCDSDNAGTLKITAYCTILQSGIPSVWDWSWAPGAFVTSIGGVSGYTSKDKDDNPVYHYWNWSLNGSDGTTGLNQYDLQPNDSILLNFVDPVEPVITKPTPEVSSHSSSSGSYVVTQKLFSLPSAIYFLSSQQKSDGSFGDSLYTDWVTIGIAKEGNDASELKNKLFNYLKKANFESPNVTDYERHAMALMSLDINPYTGTNVNYIKKITDSFDGTQIGDKNLFNDDIFGLIILQNSGYTDDDQIIQKTISYVISKQSPDGSWGSVDMTSAGIEALNKFKSVSGVSDALSKAENYLSSSQNADGGFLNTSSTSWAIQAMSLDNSLDENVKSAVKYLADKQQNDGGLDGDDINSRVWVTSYVIPAVLKLSWNDILDSFPREEIKNIPIQVIKTQDKKINIIKNPIKIKPIFKEDSKDNSLEASAGSFDQNNNNNTFSSPIHKVLRKIASPFVWLWIKLGF